MEMDAAWQRARETRFCIEGSAGPVELLVNGVEHARAIALICHPHPLHGGSLDNKVVFTLARACRDQHILAVRFNFRGVGASAGVHDNGVGELRDAACALQWLHAQCCQLPVVLCGFSFGAAIAAQLAQTAVCSALILAAPPVPRYGLQNVVAVSMPVLLLQGDDDEVIDSARVDAWFSALHAPEKREKHWPVCGHFFHGLLPELKVAVEDFLAETL